MKPWNPHFPKCWCLNHPGCLVGSLIIHAHCQGPVVWEIAKSVKRRPVCLRLQRSKAWDKDQQELGFGQQKMRLDHQTYGFAYHLLRFESWVSKRAKWFGYPGVWSFLFRKWEQRMARGMGFQCWDHLMQIATFADSKLARSSSTIENQCLCIPCNIFLCDVARHRKFQQL